MAKFTRGNGKMVDSMGLDFSPRQEIVSSPKKVNGSMDVDLIGYMNKNVNIKNKKVSPNFI